MSDLLPGDTDVAAAQADLISHWDEIPGWPPDRLLYACYFTTSDQPELQELVADYQRFLAGIPGLDLILPPWLHMSIQGVRFLDDLQPDQVTELAHNLDTALGAVEPFEVTVERPVVSTDSALMPLRPTEPIAAVRDEIRSVIGELPAFGDLVVLPGQEGDFDPHVSIAYVNAGVSRQVLVDAIAACPREPLTITVRQVSMITLSRSAQKYHWVDERPIKLGR